MMFHVIATETYLEELKKWDKRSREEAEKLPVKLKSNPSSGKPLGYPFLREKRIHEKRIYYIVYEDLKLVLLVATSGKKNQQATINHIKENLEAFKEVAEDISKQLS